jgi:BASS family bile acid:Na+ symporter
MFEHYAAYEYWLAATQLALLMLGMGAMTHLSDFTDLVRRPRAVLVGIAVQLLLVPPLAVVASHGLGATPGVTLGLVLISAMPGGTMSNLFTLFARGNVPLSITLTALATAACIVTTPLVLRLLALGHLPPGFAMPTEQIVFEIAFVLLLPLAFGMAVGHTLPAWRDGISRWCIRGSILMIVLIAIGAGGSGRIDPTRYGWAAPAAIALFVTAIQAVAAVAGRLARLERRDVVAIVIEVTIRNTNLGLLVKASLFPAVAGIVDPLADAVLYVVLIYGGVATLWAIPLLVWHRRVAAPAPVNA